MALDGPRLFRDWMARELSQFASGLRGSRSRAQVLADQKLRDSAHLAAVFAIANWPLYRRCAQHVPEP